MQLHGLRLLGGLDVQDFDEEGESPREIDVARVDVLAHAFGYQKHADEDEEGQGQDLDCWLAFDKSADRIGEKKLGR